ncbi:MAG: DUF937 domain-containing protein [Candidatus Aminicenantes bacterium]|nr:DUF937 domain-containing protein [Candidatus Aminicenantes bacterium]
MSDFVSDFMRQFGPDVSRQLSASLGVKPEDASRLLPQVIPMIMGGLKKQMETRGGAQRLDHILNKYGREDVLNDIGGTIAAKAREANPDPQLGGLLGQSGVQASQMFGQMLGLSSQKAMSLIPMLAPLILGALSKRKNQAGGSGLDGLAGLIDKDGDGNILDDIAGFLGPALGGGSASRGGGLLGGLLGGLFGKKR